MEKRSRRRMWLTILAVGNLVVWVTLAATVGLLASDAVDVGAESLFREFQATAGAVIEELPQQLVNPSSRLGSSSVVAETEDGDAPKVTEALTWPESSSDPSAAAPGDSSASDKAIVTNGSGASEAVSDDAGSSPAASGSSQGQSGGLILLSDPDWQALNSMDAEVRASAPGRPVQIRYSEAALNRQLAELLAYYPEQPYGNIVVDLERDSVSITGDVAVLGFQVGTTVEGTVTATNCQPHVNIESIKIAGLLTPGFVKDGVKDLIVESLNQYPTSYPLCLEQIVVEEDRATVYGSRR